MSLDDWLEISQGLSLLLITYALYRIYKYSHALSARVTELEEKYKAQSDMVLGTIDNLETIEKKVEILISINAVMHNTKFDSTLIGIKPKPVVHREWHGH